MTRKLHTTVAAVLLSSLSAACARADGIVIDSFDYPTPEAARQAWRPAPDSPPVEVVRRNGGRAVAFPCDWSKVDKRLCYDRAVELNLSRFGTITFWVYAGREGAVNAGSIYFKSDGGWYRGSFPIRRKGWQQIVLDRTQFGREGTPAGWHRIHMVRLSFWKPSERAAGKVVLAADLLEAHGAPVVVVRGELTIRRGSGEARLVEAYCSYVARLLREAGVNYTVIDDTDVANGGLDGAKLAIFPYSPDASDREVDATARFIAGGGKVMLFYCLPEKLTAGLGITDAGWTRQSYPGQFATLRIDATALPGAPQRIRQGSWNIRKVRPLGAGARIAGQWVDIRGRPTGIPALTLSQAGLYMGHILTPGDEAAKKRFLLAAIGALIPRWRPALAEAALDRAARVEGFAGTDEMRRHLESRRGKVPGDRIKKALELLGEADSLLETARGRLDAGAAGAFSWALASGDKSRQLIEEALQMSFPSWRPEFRAVWCHSAFGVPGWSWDRAIGHLKGHGFNAIVVNMLWAGRAYYPSELLPLAADAKADQLAECLAACRKHGVQLHVWKVNFNLAGASKDFIDRMRRAGRLQADLDGSEVPWLSPSHPDNLALERDSMLDVVRRYEVDGIHFDYIRYRDSRSDYSAGARQRFEQAAGVKVKRWPDDVVSGPHAAAFADWRREQITRLVREVSAAAKKIRPGVKVSAAVFKNYPACRESVGQDWAAWVRSGYLDFICPMNYTNSDAEFESCLGNELQLLGKGARVYPGVGVTATASALSPIQAARQLSIARRLGAPGFVIFNYGLPLATEHLPALRKGLLQE